MKKLSKKVVDPRFAKSAEYKKVIHTIAGEGKCPFCPDNFKYHKNPILKTQGNWFITKSSWPYQNSQHHFLVIGKKHKELLSELTSADWRAITVLMNWAVAKFKIKGGGLAMRFGDTAHTGATVCHLHAHLISPKLNPKTGTAYTVEFPIG